MNLKKIIICFLLLFPIFTADSYSKALPPGSGEGDVPANILIMLDRSGSMGEAVVKGSGFKYVVDIVADDSGNVWGINGSWNANIKKVDFDTDDRVDDFGTNGLSQHSSWGVDCEHSSPHKIEYDPVGEKIYYPNSAWVWWNPTKIAEIDATTGACVNDWDMGSGSGNLKSLEVHDNKLYVALQNDLKWIDLNTKTVNTCTWSGELKSAIENSQEILIDSAGSYFLVAKSQDMYVFEMNGNCPKTSQKTKWSVGAWTHSMEFHPGDDNIIFLTNSWGSNIQKWEMDANKDGTLIKSIGTFSSAQSTTTNTYTYITTGISVDGTNNRVYAASQYKHSFQAFDFDLDPIVISGVVAERGGSIGTRMDGAHAAIRGIVSDSSLQSKVNFGFAWWTAKNCVWKGTKAFGYTSWNASKSQANPCNSDFNCLKVKVDEDGFEKIQDVIDDVNPSGCTDANVWATQAKQYYEHNDSPIDNSLDCQNSYIIVIGDGDWSNHNDAKKKVESMLNGADEIKTFTMAYGGGISSSGLVNFRNMAIAGGTDDVIMADTPQELISSLKSAVSQIIADNLSFTAPSIAANIEEGGSVYQASFKYNKNRQWDGTIKRTKIKSDGSLVTDDPGNWDAETMMPGPDSRNIWTHFIGMPSRKATANINNFTRANVDSISPLFGTLGFAVSDYHRENVAASGSSHQMRCFGSTDSSRTPEDGIDDDTKGLISFVRGEDYFDYDGDCDLIEKRPKILGDIYHSEIVRVGPPIAETAYVDINQEAYYRSKKGYETWASGSNLASRDSVVYAGGNDGTVHAFDAATGVEKWAFVPPFIAGLLPSVINPALNKAGGGGSNSIYGVDGAITVHDMYFWGVEETAPGWHTILIAPYGRGGAGFSVLDITDPNNPFHMYSIYNDKLQNQVLHMDQNGTLLPYLYQPDSFGLGSFQEAITVKLNKGVGNGTTVCDDTPNTDGNYCFKGRTLTLENINLKDGDYTITLDGDDISASVTSNVVGNDTSFEFGFDVTYNADPVNNPDDITSAIAIKVNTGIVVTGTLTKPNYDYSRMGETWSSPRIFRMPNLGAGDDNIEDDKYVAVMGGGYGGYQRGLGSELLVIDLVDKINPGQLLKRIPIVDTPESNIVNSISNSPVVITGDTTKGINFTGALVYINDLEGKITKVNLTNMEHDNSVDENPIELYDTVTLFNSGSSKENGRFMFHSMDATIGGDTKQLWLFAGTGNYQRINDPQPGTSNILVGIRDRHYPFFKKLLEPEVATDRDLSLCSDTTNDGVGTLCPENAQLGWVVYLENKASVTNEPTVSRNKAYFPIYEPQAVAKCDLGNGYICAMDDECGTNNSAQLSSAALSSMCYLGGSGVISKVVVFAGKLFANIAGSGADGGSLISVKAVDAGADGYRSSWRENY